MRYPKRSIGVVVVSAVVSVCSHGGSQAATYGPCVKFVDFDKREVDLSGLVVKAKATNADPIATAELGKLATSDSRRPASDAIEREDALQYQICTQIEVMPASPERDSIRKRYVLKLIDLVDASLKSGGEEDSLRKDSTTKHSPPSPSGTPDAANFSALISGGYQGQIALAYRDSYLGTSYGRATIPIYWQLIPTKHPTYGKFYWICVPGTMSGDTIVPHTTHCWQSDARGGLNVWDQDGKGQTPEDQEMFAFDGIDPSSNKVRVRSVYGPLYIRLNAEKFDLSGSQTNADSFRVLFP
jgi:hypothetical protein